jgi:hypothetical protein
MLARCGQRRIVSPSMRCTDSFGAEREVVDQLIYAAAVLQCGQMGDGIKALKVEVELASDIALVSATGKVASSEPASTKTGAATFASSRRWSGRRGTTLRTAHVLDSTFNEVTLRRT